MKDSLVKMGTQPENWNRGLAKSITFCVTEACNLACRYCYMTGKNNKNKLEFDVAKKAVDYILSNREFFNDSSVIWDFIGGEPFLEIELIDKICDYIKYQMYILDHPWFNSYRLGFSTNGLLYHLPEVQNFIKKNKGHVSVGFSVDGNKIKHDLQRIKPDGSGSYDDVMKNVPLWLKQFSGYASTKATFSHDDLPHVKDSIISLWNAGIDMVSANVVFEDVWHEGDDVLFENQLKELADYVIENKLWDDFSVRFFEPQIGFPLTQEEKSKNWCGSGKMLAIDTKGNFYPCIRFYDMSLNNKKSKDFGNIYDGINSDMFRAFEGLDLKSQSTEECLNCEVASGCAWCTGYNYDIAETDTIYNRATYICKMHKANVRATEYFWQRFAEASNLESERERIRRNRIELETTLEEQVIKNLQFITDDTITPHCTYRNTGKTINKMSLDIFKKGIAFAKINQFKPVILGTSNPAINEYLKDCFTIVGSSESHIQESSLIVYDNNSNEVKEIGQKNCILLVNKNNISNILTRIKQLSCHNERINIILENIEKWGNEDINNYKQQLELLVGFLEESYIKGSILEINVLTDILNSKSMCNCDAGENTFSLAPNGRIYICPAFYFNNPDSHIGSLEEGIKIKDQHLLKIENAYICSECDAYHCRRCKFQNKTLTGEINTPSRMQCVISHVEREFSKQLQARLKNYYIFRNLLSPIDYVDPLEKIKDRRSVVNV